MIVANELIGREGDRRRVLEALNDRSVLMMGPRRVGKTELLSRLAAERGGSWRFVHVDLQGQTTVAEFVKALKRSLDRAGLLGSLEGLAERVDRVEFAGLALKVGEQAQLWDAAGELISRAVASLDDGQDLVLAVDEVPWWLDAVEAGDAGGGRVALARLRAFRQPGAFERRVRMVLTGSIGLVDIAGEFGASAEINDLLPVVQLRPLAPDYGTALFEAELTRFGITKVSPEACRRAQEVSAGFPHWVKLLAQRAAASGGEAVDVEHVDGAAADLLGFRNRIMFEDEGREHFERRFGPEATRAAWAMLDVAAAKAEGAGHEALVAGALAEGAKTRRRAEELIYRLADSWYIEETDGGWKFMLPLFRQWWLKYGGAR